MQPGRTNGERRAPENGADLPHSLELPEILFIAIFIPIAAFSWIGILLAEFGAFTGWRVCLGGIALSAVALVAAARDLRASRASIARVSPARWLLLGLVLILAAWLFSRPGEYVIEGGDASVYLATGRHIQRTGGISSADPLVALMPAELRDSFFLVGRAGRQQQVLLPGGLPIGSDARVHPSFFHLLPVWIAIATAAAGPTGGYFVNVILAVLGVMAVALIGRRLWSPAAGLTAAALLAVNFGQIFYARLPSSEMLAQFLGLSAVFFTLLVWDHRTRLAGACAGVAAGLAAFTRVDALFLIVFLAVAWLVVTRRRKSIGPAWTWYATMLAVVATHAVVHGATIARLYIARLATDGWPRLLRAVTFLGATTAIVLVFTVAAGTFLIIKYRERSLIWVGICAGLALMVLPTPMIVMLNQLLSPIGLIAAVAGLALVFVKCWDPRVLVLVVPVMAQTALLLVWTETTILPADFRRTVPLMLPAVTLLIGFLATYLGSGRRWLARAIWLVPLGLGARFAIDSAAIVRSPVMQSVETQVAELARQIPPNALVMLDGSVPGHLPLALHYGFDRPSVRMLDRPSGNRGIAPLIAAALDEGRPVFVAVAPLVEVRLQQLWRSDFAAFDIQHQTTVPLRYTVLVPSRGAFPRQFRTDDVPVAVYRVAARDHETRTSLPFVIDVGGNDFQALVDGFHAPEQLQSVSARWTNGDSRIAVPRLAAPESGTMTMVLRMSADRPPGQPSPVVRIAIDGMPAGAIGNLTPRLSEYRISLPAEVRALLLAGPTMMSMTSDSFVPSVVGLNDDKRRLGVVLDWVRIE